MVRQDNSEKPHTESDMMSNSEERRGRERVMDEYRLPFMTYSQNKYTGRHWSFKHQINKEQAILTRHEMPPKNPRPWPVRLTIKSYRHRKLDYGNLIGGCKGLVDILVRLGYLWDDSPIWVDDNYQQYTIPKAMRPHTVVQLTDLTRMELDTTQRHEIAKQQGAEQPWKKAERAKAENALKRKAKRLENNKDQRRGEAASAASPCWRRKGG